jgi:glutathione S-transferase
MIGRCNNAFAQDTAIPRVTYGNELMTQSGADIILITIPLSHYCEKARWALDRVGLAYREQAHAPLVHRLFTMRQGGGTVPMLLDGSRRIVDSTDILLYADAAGGGDLLYPVDPVLRGEVELLEEMFDAQLGPHSRRWAYAHLLPHPALIRSLWTRGAPTLEAKLLRLIVPLVRRLVRASYRVSPASGERSLERVQAVFDKVEERLTQGRRFLVGERFTAADLTFAALSAPMVLPVQCRAVQPTLEEVPASIREEILRLRETIAGRFALRLFEEERVRVVQSHRTALEFDATSF